MKEKDFINTIKAIVSSDYIGDDCAYLKDLGIVVTQDSLIENIHFKMEYTTPYKLGWKSVMVNISDVCASGAEPKYITVALSLPNWVRTEFVADFYKGMKAACGNVEIVGGDITGADKLCISIAAIGVCAKRNIASRFHAKPGHKIVVSGEHGSSGAGLRMLISGRTAPEKFIEAHLCPCAQVDFSKKIAESVHEHYAMMDTSDGLMDACSQIADASGVNIEIDFNKIPYDQELTSFVNYRDLVLFGGEDYQLVAAVPEFVAKNFTIIGEVKPGYGVTLLNAGSKTHFSKLDVERKIYNHFL